MSNGSVQAFFADVYAVVQNHVQQRGSLGCTTYHYMSFFHIPSSPVQAFFADIYAEARKAKPGAGHMALAQIAQANKLLRHYTMNIDGLAEAAGMDTWHVESNPTGVHFTLHSPAYINLDGLSKAAGTDAWHAYKNPTAVRCLQRVLAKLYSV